MSDLIETRSNKRGRPGGMARASLDLIDRMALITEEAHPITGRGVGYKLFTMGLIPSMSKNAMQRVYRLLKEAREQGMIPWDHIVDETRGIERVAQWNDPEEYAEATVRDYRRDFWSQQPMRCEVWSEKGTVRGVLKPLLDQYGVGFNPVHGFTSATDAHDAAASGWDPRPLTALYVGDWDPSGMCMSERDLPKRMEKYGGDHITIKRISLTEDDIGDDLPSFPASDKRKDPRYKWFVENYGNQCWELDAMDPNDLRSRVESHIRACIRDRAAWKRCEQINKAERESLREGMNGWLRAARRRR